jgi:hypothetical protein
MRAGVFDGNIAKDAMKFAFELHGDALGDGERPVMGDSHGVVKVGNLPGAGVGGSRQTEKEKDYRVCEPQMESARASAHLF